MVHPVGGDNTLCDVALAIPCVANSIAAKGRLFPTENEFMTRRTSAKINLASEFRYDNVTYWHLPRRFPFWVAHRSILQPSSGPEGLGGQMLEAAEDPLKIRDSVTSFSTHDSQKARIVMSSNALV